MAAEMVTGRVWPATATRRNALDTLLLAGRLVPMAVCLLITGLALAAKGVEGAPLRRATQDQSIPSSSRWAIALTWLGRMPLERRQQLSDLTGTASFVVWLFAQSPQLYENYKNASCDGLSIVFLVQWMAGDVTNLLGSILTRQLPFQIAIATYFCCIDACILLQYYYYWHRDRRLAVRVGRDVGRVQMPRRMRLSRSTSTAQGLEHDSPAQTTRDMIMSDSISSLASSSRSLLLPRRYRAPPSSSEARGVSASTRVSAQGPQTTRDVHLDRGIHNASRRPPMHSPHHSYRALEQAARSVAELAHEAEEAAARREARQKRRRERFLAEARRDAFNSDKLNKGEALAAQHTDEEEDNTAAANMEASVVSLSSPQSTDESEFPFGIHSVPDLRFTSITSPVAATDATRPSLPASQSTSSHRGRDMSRTATSGEMDTQKVEADETAQQDSAHFAAAKRARGGMSHSTTRSAQRGSSLARRNTGLVFLGVAAIFGFSGDFSSRQTQVGYGAASPKATPIPMGRVVGLHPPSQLPSNTAKDTLHWPSSSTNTVLHYVSTLDKLSTDAPNGHRMPPTYDHAPATWDKLVGRISAWACALLYITSRMPQIWTNLQRRSVQGLSILLFIAAATGNLLYSISVLIHPKASAPPSSPQERFEYLLESLPFLLGSGGTLIFDAIIVSQWVAWRGKEPDLILCNETTGEAIGPFPFGDLLAHTHPRTHARRDASRSASRPRAHSRWPSLEHRPLLH